MNHLLGITLYTSVICATLFMATKAQDPFKTHNDINRKCNENYAFSAQRTMQQYIQQGKPVPPIPFLPIHAQIAAQQHNARLAAAATTPQQNAADAQLQTQPQTTQQPGGCAQQ